MQHKKNIFVYFLFSVLSTSYLLCLNASKHENTQGQDPNKQLDNTIPHLLNSTQTSQYDLESIKANLCFSQGVSYMYQRQYKKAEQSLEEAKAIYRKLGDKEKIRDMENMILNLRLRKAIASSDQVAIREILKTKSAKGFLKETTSVTKSSDKASIKKYSEEKKLLDELEIFKKKVEKSQWGFIQPDNANDIRPLQYLLNLYIRGGEEYTDNYKMTKSICLKVVRLINEMGYNLVNQSIFSHTVEIGIINCYSRVKDWEHIIEFSRTRLNAQFKLSRHTDLLDYLDEAYTNHLNNSDGKIFNTRQRNYKFDFRQIVIDSGCINTVEISNASPTIGLINKPSLCIGRDDTYNRVTRVLTDILLPETLLGGDIKIKHACLYLYREGGNMSQMALYKIKSAWKYEAANWLEKSTGLKWETPGGDVLKKPIATSRRVPGRGSINGRHFRDMQKFEITDFIQDSITNGHYGFVIKELYEENQRERSATIFDGNPPMIRIEIVFSGKTNPKLRNISNKYVNTWISLYSEGMDEFLKGNLGKTMFLWAEAVKSTKDERIRYKIVRHMKIIAEYLKNNPEK